MADFKAHIGAALKAARVKQGLSMKELAVRLGVSGTTTISRYESGKLNLSADLIEKIAKGIGVKPEILFRPIQERN